MKSRPHRNYSIPKQTVSLKAFIKKICASYHESTMEISHARQVCVRECHYWATRCICYTPSSSFTRDSVASLSCTHTLYSIPFRMRAKSSVYASGYSLCRFGCSSSMIKAEWEFGRVGYFSKSTRKIGIIISSSLMHSVTRCGSRGKSEPSFKTVKKRASGNDSFSNSVRNPIFPYNAAYPISLPK